VTTKPLSPEAILLFELELKQAIDTNSFVLITDARSLNYSQSICFGYPSDAYFFECPVPEN